MKIGIIREGKVPPDSRVPLIPQHCKQIMEMPGIELVVQPSPGRCFSDEEFTAAGVPMSEDLSDCDVLMGVKEVPIKSLIADKTYFFFSHTIKKQAYNRQLLWAILDKNIRLLDYEVLTNEKGRRVIAFGKFAGMVGAHNGLWTYAQRTGVFELPRMNSFHDYEEVKELYNKTAFPNVKIVLTGTGRVATGAAMVLQDMGFHQASPKDFLEKDFDQPVFTQLTCSDYAARKDGGKFLKKDFYENPQAYKSIFQPYTLVADIMVNGIYWDNLAPAFFTVEEMQSPDFQIGVIADVTCDIAPVTSIPSTLSASTIEDPVFGFDPETGEEVAPYQDHAIDMMTIDNLPNELPRDASTAFGEMFLEHVLPELVKENSEMIERATVTENGILGKHFNYLTDYASM